MKRLLMIGILMPLLCSIGTASILYNNGSPNQASADSISDTLVAEDLPISAAATITGFEFWDIEGGAGSYNGSIAWILYSNVSNLPGVIVAQGLASTAGQITRTATANTNVNGFAEVDNVVNATASLTSGSLTLAAGTYWLGLHDGPLGTTTFQDFYWETTDTNATIFGVGQDLTVANQPFVDTTQEHAFNVSGDLLVTPEPASIALMAAGMVGVAIFGRRKESRRKA